LDLLEVQRLGQPPPEAWALDERRRTADDALLGLEEPEESLDGRELPGDRDEGLGSQRRVEEVGRVRGYWPGAPDLAVEVISPSDTYTEVEDKVLAWLDAGTRMVAVLNPRHRTITVHRSRTDITILAENDTLDGQDVVPGWMLSIEDLFV